MYRRWCRRWQRQRRWWLITINGLRFSNSKFTMLFIVQMKKLFFIMFPTDYVAVPNSRSAHIHIYIYMIHAAWECGHCGGWGLWKVLSYVLAKIVFRFVLRCVSVGHMSPTITNCPTNFLRRLQLQMQMYSRFLKWLPKIWHFAIFAN